MTTNWTCEQTESRLIDYLDGLLQPAELAAFHGHAQTCDRCAPLISSVTGVLTNLHALPELDTPPQLIYAILDKTLGPRDAVTGWAVVLAWFRRFSLPRLAYGSASLALTFLILATASGFSWRKPKMADLSPASVFHNADRQAHLVYARGTKFVSDLRVVYEIQSRLRQDNELPSANEETIPQSAPGNKTPGSTDRTDPAVPRQQNRANDSQKNQQVLAVTLVPVADVPSFAIFSSSLCTRRTP